MNYTSYRSLFWGSWLFLLLGHSSVTHGHNHTLNSPNVPTETITNNENLLRLYVDWSATAGNQTGEDWDNAFLNLQDALAYTASNPTTDQREIWVAAGIYYPDEGGNAIDNDRNASFVMRNNLAIYGGFAGDEEVDFDLNLRDFTKNETVLSGDIDQNDEADFVNNGGNSYHVFFNNRDELDATAVLDGFTLTGGNANGNFPYNAGGGVFNYSSPTLTNCTFKENQAKGNGGGVFNSSSSPLLTGCTFSSNKADGSGGGIYNSTTSSPILINCMFNDNRANRVAGGMFNSSSSSSVTNCTFSGNQANFSGGAIYNSSSSISFINCTFSGNESDGNGGGIFNSFSSSSTLTNCIIWNSRDRSGTGTAKAGISNTNNSTFSATYSLIQGHTLEGAGNFDGADPNNDPLFISTENIQLQPCSPAINRGDNSVNSLTTDLAGNPRIFNGTIDLGAHEFQGDLDGEAPVFSSDVPTLAESYPTDPNVCVYTVVETTLDPSVTDNCAVTTLTYSADNGAVPANGTSLDGAVFQLGTTTVMWTATDARDNSSTMSYAFQIIDAEPPSFTLPTDRTLSLNNNCQIMIPDLVSEVTDVTDNCVANPTVTQNPTANTVISLNHNQTTTVEIMVSDGVNDNKKMVTLTAKDRIRPQLQINPHTVTLNANGSYTLIASDLATLGAGSTDNCTDFANLNFAATPNTFDCSVVGTQAISLTATDAANNAITMANVDLLVLAPPSEFTFTPTAQVSETDGTTTLTLTISRTNAACTATLDFATQNGTAQAGSDYVVHTGTLNFAAGQVSQMLTLEILGDTEAENNEIFQLVFSNPTNNHQLTDNAIEITILDNDTRNTILDFDGIDDQIVVEDLHLSQGLTLEMWVNYAGSQTAMEALFSHQNNTFSFGFDQGVLRLFSTQLQTQSAFPTNVWKHLVLTINNSGRIGSLYVDGALVASEFPLNPEHQENTARGIFGMGTGLSGANAQLDEVRLWNYMRSFGEIQENMNCELTGTEEGLELYFDFADGIPNGDNTNVTGVADRSGQYGNVPISGFDLVGLESNFLKSDLDLINNCATALAVDALSLQAKWKDSGAVHLKWQATIRNAATAFTVERSTNGKDFTIIERIAAHAQYQFYDKAAPYGTVYYRIGHQNANGTTTYSNVQQLDISFSTPLIVAPNPTNGQVTVQSSTAILAWELLDTHGRSVRIVKLAEPHPNFDVNISSLPKGIYLLQVQTATDFYYERILLQ